MAVFLDANSSIAQTSVCKTIFNFNLFILFCYCDFEFKRFVSTQMKNRFQLKKGAMEFRVHTQKIVYELKLW